MFTPWQAIAQEKRKRRGRKGGSDAKAALKSNLK